MSNKLYPVVALLALACVVTSASRAAELRTLFTTPAERQLINSNRHNTEDETEVVEVEETRVDMSSLQQLVQKEFTREYLVSGITLSQEGAYTVWINGKSYEDGGVLEDASKVEVISGDNLRVRITTPDGNQHYALSGEMLEVRFLAAVDEHDVDVDDHSAYIDYLGDTN